MTPVNQNIQQLEACARAGHAESQYYLGVCLAQGIGVPLDQDTALKWVRRAAGKGHIPAQTWLGNLYLSAHDEERARYWYEQAALLGNSDAMYYLSLIYLRGNVLGADPDIAFQWLKKAADHEHLDAMGRLGYMYCLGIGTKQNYELAMIWFEKAGHLGDTVAQALLGTAFLTGCGVQKHEHSARYWFSQLKLSVVSPKTLTTLADIVFEGSLMPRSPVAAYILLCIHGKIYPDFKVNLEPIVSLLSDYQLHHADRMVKSVIEDKVAFMVQ